MEKTRVTEAWAEVGLLCVLSDTILSRHSHLQQPWKGEIQPFPQPKIAKEPIKLHKWIYFSNWRNIQSWLLKTATISYCLLNTFEMQVPCLFPALSFRLLLLLWSDFHLRPGYTYSLCFLWNKPVRKGLPCIQWCFWVYKRCDKISDADYDEYSRVPKDEVIYFCLSCKCTSRESPLLTAHFKSPLAKS